MATRHQIRFLLNGQETHVDDAAASDTLLDFLRISRRLTGTKEGCAEGDCGACTVLVGRLKQGQLHYEPVNACIRFLASVDNCHVVTIEHLRGADGGLHPVQRAMIEHHGSQCGFCTPGIVMALYALWMETPRPSRAQVDVALQGNLCRCTGYEPIARAAMDAARHGGPEGDILHSERATVTAVLHAWQDGGRVATGPEGNRAILPADLDDFATLYADTPDATVVAGATDVGLWVTKFLRPITPALFIGHLEELQGIDTDGDMITIGAGVTYSEAEAAMVQAFPHLRAYWQRIAGWQVRNAGTIGGNIANGSPIGDMPPVLIALGARVVLRKGAARRDIPLEAFFVDYGKQDRAAGEFVEAIRVPKPAPGAMHSAWKISKRRDEDISSVAAAISITVDGGVITGAHTGFGGMAATPRRAAAAEAALIGQPFEEATFSAAAKALEQDFTPLSDWRASAAYRMRVAQNLLLRFWATHKATDGTGDMAELSFDITEAGA